MMMIIILILKSKQIKPKSIKNFDFSITLTRIKSNYHNFLKLDNKGNKIEEDMQNINRITQK